MAGRHESNKKAIFMRITSTAITQNKKNGQAAKLFSPDVVFFPNNHLKPGSSKGKKKC